MKKLMVMMFWSSAAMLTLAACSKDELNPVRDKGYGEGSVVIAAAAADDITVSATRADGDTISLTRLGVPANMLTSEWIMGHLRTRVECVENDEDGISRSSADEFNKDNPRLSPVPAKYNVTMGNLTGDRVVLPGYTNPDGGTVANLEAPEYRHNNPGAKLIPNVAEGEGYEYMYLEGWTEFELQAGKNPQPVNVEVRVANTAVTVVFTDAFRKYFANGAKVTIKTKANSAPKEIASYTAGDAGKELAARYYWVRPQEFTLSTVAYRQNPSPGIFDAEERQLADYTVSVVNPQTLYRCVFDVSNVGGIEGGITVTIDDTPVFTEDLGEEELNPGAPGAPEN